MIMGHWADSHVYNDHGRRIQRLSAITQTFMFIPTCSWDSHGYESSRKDLGPRSWPANPRAKHSMSEKLERDIL